MNILRLIIKDYRANWMYLALLLAVLFAMSASFMLFSLKELGQYAIPSDNKTPVESELYILIVMMSGMLSSMLFTLIEHSYRIESVFASLPVTRAQLVLSKYVSTFLQIFLILLTHILAIQLVVLVMGNISHPGLEIIFNPGLWIGLLLLLMLFKCFSYPFYFKLGLVKGVVVFNILPFVSLVLLLLGLEIFNIKWNVTSYIVPLWKAFFNQHELTILVELLVGYLLIVSLSMSLSIRFYKNKEL